MLLIIDPALKINHTSASSYLFPLFFFYVIGFFVVFLGGGLSHVFLRTLQMPVMSHILMISQGSGPYSIHSYLLKHLISNRCEPYVEHKLM